MFKALKSLFGGSQVSQVQVTRPTMETIIAPEQPFFAIGDIHGCLAPFTELMAQIKATSMGEEAVIFVGDMIDRGPASADVLAQVYHWTQERPEEAVALMGNHERMMLDFIDDPSGRGARWLANGGIETLASYGITAPGRRPDAEDALELADALEGALPDGMQEWLRALPLMWHSGNMYCVHAAMDPSKSVNRQKSKTLLWGHPEFLKTPREDGVCVVHGHTIMTEPFICDGRISIDTGAFQGGALSAVRVQGHQASFIQV